jgi:hypothetical protein
MHRLITLACAVTAATLIVVGCGSSDDSSSSSNGGSGGSGGTSANAQCVGDYSDLTQSAFTAKLASDGKCIDASDATVVCTNDVTKTAETCGGDCYKKGGDSAAQDACTSDCLNGNLTPTLSADCLACYVADVGCARTHCLLQCGVAPTSSACATCRQTNGCVDAFYSCSGVPLPASAAAGGSGGAAPMGAAGEPATSAGAGG